MIASVHLADVGVQGALRSVLRGASGRCARPGLRWGTVMLANPLSEATVPAPDLHRVGFIGFWDSDDAVDAFLADDPRAAPLATGWHARLSAVRRTGDWPGLPDEEVRGRTEGPAVTLTLGRLRMSQATRFLAASARAEALALAAPGFVWGTALARPPVVATCSLWRDSPALAAYAYRSGAHADAIDANERRPFHRRSAFVRFRPYHSAGRLDGRNPLPADWMATPDATTS